MKRVNREAYRGIPHPEVRWEVYRKVYHTLRYMGDMPGRYTPP